MLKPTILMNNYLDFILSVRGRIFYGRNMNLVLDISFMRILCRNIKWEFEQITLISKLRSILKNINMYTTLEAIETNESV